MPHKGNQTMIVPAADAALAVAYSPASLISFFVRQQTFLLHDIFTFGTKQDNNNATNSPNV